ncbi:MAG: hypothetical protein HY718_18580 [Planctomycetes bacterium]|nr:hypothetical protein [Planctomycetota bacterium]
MDRLRCNIFKILMILALVALPGSDIECEDDEFEFNWPSFHHDDGYWVYEPVYIEPAPCCWFW